MHVLCTFMHVFLCELTMKALQMYQATEKSFPVIQFMAALTQPQPFTLRPLTWKLRLFRAAIS